MRIQNLLVNSILCLCFLCLSLTAGSATLAQNDEPTDENRASAIPSASAEAAVRRFMKESVLIQPGTPPFPRKFAVGSRTPAEFELQYRETELPSEFRIAKFETTQELYLAVMGRNPSRWQGPRNSVENVQYSDAVAFCETLTTRLQAMQLIPNNEVVRLPTAVEWEYCCRAGSSTRYGFGDSVRDSVRDPEAAAGTELLDTYAWHTGNAAGNDPAVGVLKPNAWGLYDVHGYLSEFVSGSDPSVASGQERLRMIRGGSWKDQHPRLSSSTYFMIPGDSADDAVGFRCIIAKKLP